ncbi:MAG: type II secretion system minor pseudopilin GspK [Dokdonella sp.]
MKTPPQRQRGVALLVALLVVALAVILIAALLDRGELAFARTRNALRSEQADAYAQGLEIYAAQILREAQDEQRQPDTNHSPWALPLPPQPVPGGLMKATMRDLNGCFNLNNLATASTDYVNWRSIFNTLLKNLSIDPTLALAVEAWVDPSVSDSAVSPSYYASLPVPYRPRGDLFAHVSELRLVAGVTAEVYAKLAPQVCALPPGTTINVNTASAVVLQSVTGVSAARATALWKNGQADFQSIPDLVQAEHIDDLSTTMFDVYSSYFLARGDIVLDDVPFAFYSVIERRLGGVIHVLARSRGSDDTLTVAAPIAASSHDDATLD